MTAPVSPEPGTADKPLLPRPTCRVCGAPISGVPFNPEIPHYPTAVVDEACWLAACLHSGALAAAVLVDNAAGWIAAGYRWATLLQEHAAEAGVTVPCLRHLIDAEILGREASGQPVPDLTVLLVGSSV